MSGCIKYFDNGGKNMSFVTDDKEVYEKYDEIWNVVKRLLKLKFTASPIRFLRFNKYKVKHIVVYNRVIWETLNRTQ